MNIKPLPKAPVLSAEIERPLRNALVELYLRINQLLDWLSLDGWRKPTLLNRGEDAFNSSAWLM